MTYQKDSIVYQPIPTHPQFVDITGRQFVRLTVLGYAGRYSPTSKKQTWFCECECGTIKTVSQSALKSGLQSCGCVRDEKIGALNRTHGMANTHPLYGTWLNMRRRCYDEKCPKYPTYASHGIQVCKRWRESFPHFLEDMGNEKPSRIHSIERVDNEGHYSCGHCSECVKNEWTANCIWATPPIQSRNTRTNHMITFNGKTQILADWAHELGMSYGCLSRRLNKLKWSDEKALTTPVHVPANSFASISE